MLKPPLEEETERLHGNGWTLFAAMPGPILRKACLSLHDPYTLITI